MKKMQGSCKYCNKNGRYFYRPFFVAVDGEIGARGEFGFVTSPRLAAEAVDRAYFLLLPMRA